MDSQDLRDSYDAAYHVANNGEIDFAAFHVALKNRGVPFGPDAARQRLKAAKRFPWRLTGMKEGRWMHGRGNANRVPVAGVPDVFDGIDQRLAERPKGEDEAEDAMAMTVVKEEETKWQAAIQPKREQPTVASEKEIARAAVRRYLLEHKRGINFIAKKVAANGSGD